ncbi:MAG: hypothetical protein U0903_20970 [Planctomycetales bacterium]
MAEKPAIPIKYSKLDVAQYTNELIVQVDADALYLHFCQTQPPLRIPESQGDEVVHSVPLASVAIPRNRAQAFIDVMQSQLDEIKSVLAARQTAKEEGTE